MAENAIQVDCCSCWDCGWVDCDMQRQDRSYSQSFTIIPMCTYCIFRVFDLVKHEWVCENDHQFGETTTSTLASLTTSMENTNTGSPCTEASIEQLRTNHYCSKTFFFAVKPWSIKPNTSTTTTTTKDRSIYKNDCFKIAR